MNKLMIIDLMGTLLDAICITSPDNSMEYRSKLMSVCRKLNVLLEQQNEIIILTDYSHATIDNMKKVLNDLYKEISDNNKDRIKFMVVGIIDDNKIEEMLRQDFENTIANKLELFDDKDDAYKHIIDRYKGYAIIAIDDHPYSNNGFTMLFKQGQKTCGLLNDYGSRSWGPEIRQYDELINYAWENSYQRYLKRNFSNIDLEICAEKVAFNIDFVVSKKISYEEYLNKGVNYWNEYEKEVYNLIATLATIKQKPEYELRDDWQEIKRSLEKSKYKNDVETILKVLNIRGIINVYDLQVALFLTDKDIYNISNDELIDGYLKKLIIPCSSFTDAYEKILKYF